MIQWYVMLAHAWDLHHFSLCPAALAVAPNATRSASKRIWPRSWSSSKELELFSTQNSLFKLHTSASSHLHLHIQCSSPWIHLRHLSSSRSSCIVLYASIHLLPLAKAATCRVTASICWSCRKSLGSAPKRSSCAFRHEKNRLRAVWHRLKT